MEEYIKKTDLLAEIKRRYKFHKERNRMEDSAIQDVLYGILNFLNTLEVKEVDLEKECAKYFEENDDYIKFARHFFELGLKTQKGE